MRGVILFFRSLLVLFLLVFPGKFLVASEQLIFSAEDLYYEKQYDKAVEKLDQFLIKHPENVTALLLKARSLAALNNFPESISTYDDFVKYGGDQTLVAIEVARLRNSAGQFKENIFAIKPDKFTSDAASALYTELGFSFLNINQEKSASSAFESAIKLDHNNSDALVGKAFLAINRKNYTDAAQFLKLATKNSPKSYRVLITSGQLAYAQKQLDEAFRFFSSALEINPDAPTTRILIINALLDLGKESQARQLIEESIFKNSNVLQYYYQGYIASLVEGFPNIALSYLEQGIALLEGDSLQNDLFNNQPNLRLLAAILYRENGDLDKSETFVNKFLETNPLHYGAKKLRATIFLEKQKYRQAITELQSIAQYNSNDPSIFTAIGDAYLGAQLYSNAVKTYKEALFLKQESPGIRQRLAFALVLTGETEQALEHYKQAKIYGANTNQLFQAILENGFGYNSSVEDLLKNYQSSYPDNPLVKNVVAAIALSQGKTTEAINHLQNFSTQESSNLLIRLNLATALRQAGRDEESALILNDLDESYEKHFNLALLNYDQGNIEEAIRHMLKIDLWDKPNLKNILFFIDLHIKTGQYIQAEELIKKSMHFFPNNPLTLIRSAQISHANGIELSAKSSLIKASTNAGYDEDMLYTIAYFQTKYGHIKEALWTIDKALTKKPNNQNLLILKSRAYILAGQHKKALLNTEQLLKKHPSSIAARILLADIEYSAKNYVGALKQYKNILIQFNSPEVIVSIAKTYHRLEQTPKAIGFLRKWDNNFDKNVLIKWQLARYLLLSNQLSEAIEVFKQLEVISPQDPHVFNNLANLLLNENKAIAMFYAQKAMDFKTNDPAIIDTYGWLLLHNNKLKEALRYLRDALSRNSTSPIIHYHLAKALIANGKQNEAIDKLKIALKGDLNVDQMKDIQKQLKLLTRTGS